MRISEMTDDERREYLDTAYQHALNLHGDGDLEGGHPSRTICDWMRRGKARDAAMLDDPDQMQAGDAVSPITREFVRAVPSLSRRAGSSLAADAASRDAFREAIPQLKNRRF